MGETWRCGQSKTALDGEGADQHGVYGSGLSGSRATTEICLLDSGVAVAHGAKALPEWLGCVAFYLAEARAYLGHPLRANRLFCSPLFHFVAALLP